MEPCENNHDLIQFIGRASCPLCEALAEISKLKQVALVDASYIKALHEKINIIENFVDSEVLS